MEEKFLLLERATTTLDNMRELQAQLRAFVEEHPDPAVIEAMGNLEASIVEMDKRVTELKARISKALN